MPEQRSTDLHLAVDSGGFSLYRNKVAGAKLPRGFRGENTGVQSSILAARDFGFFRTKEFRTYFDGYMAFCHENKKQLRFYVALDVIYDPKWTWELTLEMERNGLLPVPVLHAGEDLNWFKKYLKKYEYVGLGGMGLLSTKPLYSEFARRAFSLLLNSKGHPTHKVHGFAMAGNSLLAQFPWASVDATSPFTQSRNGAILVPHAVFKKGKRSGWNFYASPKPVCMTERRQHNGGHFLQLPKAVQHCVLDFITPLGVTVEQLSKEYLYRDYVNLYYTYQVERHIQQYNQEKYGANWTFNFYISGKPSQSEETFLQTLPFLNELGVDTVKYLGTFFLPKPLLKFLDHKKGLKQ